MLKKIKPEQILKITKINSNGYLRMDYVPETAVVIHCVLKLKNTEKIPEINKLIESAEIILTSDKKEELNNFSEDKWMKIELILKNC